MDWQATSQLYFLDTYQELVYLASDRDFAGVARHELTNDVTAFNEPQTAFAAIFAGQTKRQQTARQATDWTVNKLTGKRANVIKEVRGSPNDRAMSQLLTLNPFSFSLL